MIFYGIYILIYLSIQFPTEQDEFLNKNNPLNVVFPKENKPTYI